MVWSAWEGFHFSVSCRIRPFLCWAQLPGFVLHPHPPLRQIQSLLWLWSFLVSGIKMNYKVSAWPHNDFFELSSAVLPQVCTHCSGRLLLALKPAIAVLCVYLDRKGVFPKWLFFLKSFSVFLLPLLATYNRSRFHEVLVQTLI